ncbi:MAG: hypothetical protein WCR51_00110 [Planctomycetia bacterium]
MRITVMWQTQRRLQRRVAIPFQRISWLPLIVASYCPAPGDGTICRDDGGPADADTNAHFDATVSADFDAAPEGTAPQSDPGEKQKGGWRIRRFRLGNGASRQSDESGACRDELGAGWDEFAASDHCLAGKRLGSEPFGVPEYRPLDNARKGASRALGIGAKVVRDAFHLHRTGERPRGSAG